MPWPSWVLPSWSLRILVQRRSRVHPATVLILASSLAVTACSTSEEKREKPNLLLITVDSLRADRLGFNGYVPAETPHIDSLASRGTNYTSALTPVPEAFPALVSLHTGLYPATHGVRTARSVALDGQVTTLAETLRDAGYKTAGFAASAALHPKYGLDQGFDVYAAAFEKAPRPSLIPEAGFAAERVADWALEHLETVRFERFFVWVNFFDPHYFYRPPEPFATKFTDAPYDGEVAYVDRELGRILAKLDDYGLTGSTIVVLAGSNGEALGDGGEAYHGTTLQGSTTRVPLVIVAPGFEAGARNGAPVSLIDLFPTLVELMGLPATAPMDGISLTQTPVPDRPLYLEAGMPSRLFGWAPLRGVVSGSWKYVESGAGRLFDLSEDPQELRDLSTSEAEVRERLAGMVAAHCGEVHRRADLTDQSREEIESLGFPAGAASGPQKDAYEMIAVSNDALRASRSTSRQQVQAASFLFDEVLKRDPDNYASLIGSALISRARGDRERERRLLEHAQAIYPQDAEVYHQMGHYLLGDRSHEATGRANRLFTLAARLDPKNEEALYDTACALASQGLHGQALDTLELAVQEGFRDFSWMARDKDLDSLRSDARFEALMSLEPPPGEAGQEAPPAEQ